MRDRSARESSRSCSSSCSNPAEDWGDLEEFDSPLTQQLRMKVAVQPSLYAGKVH